MENASLHTADLRIMARRDTEMKQPHPTRIEAKPMEETTPVEDELSRLAAIVTSSEDAIIGTTLKGIIFAWNKGAEQIYGYKAEAIKGEHFSTLIPPDRRDAINGSVGQIRLGKHVDAFEARRIRPDGTVIYLSTALSPIKDARERITGVSIVTRDITQARRSEEAFTRERILLRTVLDNLTDHIYVKDAAGRYILDNPAHRKFLGASSSEEVEGKTVFFFFPKALAERYHADDISVIRSGKPLLHREEPAVTRSGEKIWLSTTKVPFRDSGGAIGGLVCLSRNITAARRPEPEGKTRLPGKK